MMSVLSDEELLDLLKTKITTDRFGIITYEVNGKFHRVGGPAIIWPDGSEAWMLNGKRHRINGPAITHANLDNGKSWFIHGQIYSEKEFNKKVLTLSKIAV